MPASRAERPSRTRTARTNGRPALSLRAIPAQEINLLPGEMSLVCRDCATWCPITGLQTPKTTPHRRPVEQGAHRCPGGNQLLDVDVTFDEWREQLQVVEATATYRRAPRQHHNPLSQPPTPVHRLADREPQAQYRLAQLLERARHAVLTHRDSCPVCRAGGRCATGRELEIRLGETQASCTIAREQQERDNRLASQSGRTARAGLDGARHERLGRARQADQQRHNLAVPVGSSQGLVDEHERIRRAASWPAPTHGGLEVPLASLRVRA
ncbi:MAG TPA: hypothetical protein VIS09_02300 [Streptomyces sp.]